MAGFTFKVSGLRQRLHRNNVLLITLILIVIIFFFAIFISNYYYSTIRTGLEAKAKGAADYFANYITRTASEFYDSANKYTETFPDSNRIEVQFIDTDGRVVISTNGLTAGTSPDSEDIFDAIDTKAISVYTGRSKLTNQRVMAVSAPIIYSNGQIIGVMRYVSGLTIVDRQISKNVLIAMSFGALVVLIISLINASLVKSIIEPITEITKASRRMAGGSYGIQINKQYRDEIGEMVEAINEMSMKIAQTEKIQKEFIASVSHELRTPLTAITGWGETLLFTQNLDVETIKGIGIILKEARRLTNMVEELLEFTRIQDGRFTLNIEEVDLRIELEESIFTYQELLQHAEIELNYAPYEGKMPLIPGDPARLRQVFLNILDNAAKYARDGKEIDVSLGMTEDYVFASIRDYGEGIPQDDLENVKMKFYKGRNSVGRGSGIGLAVCEEIVRLHGGELVLENAEGGGLRVTVFLPIKRD